MNRNEFTAADWPTDSPPTAVGIGPLHENGRLVSVNMPAPDLTMAGFLRQAQGQARFFWQNGQDKIAYAGFGIAAELMAWGNGRFRDIQQQAQQLFHNAFVADNTVRLASPRLFGGFAFRDDFAPDNTWAVFHPAHFILPHYQLGQAGDRRWLTINAIVAPDEDAAAAQMELREALLARYAALQSTERNLVSPTVSPPGKIRVNYPMPYEIWQHKINEAIQQMQHGELDKVVLSRVCEIRLPGRVQVNAALAYLHTNYPNCYRFLFEPRPYHAFYGATPELLARVNGRDLTTMGLAGSARRGQTPVADIELANILLNSAKDRYEHALVVVAMQRRLKSVTERMDMPAQPIIYKLSNIQHLYTPIRATLRREYGILPIAELLHPTPALGGSPRAMAMDFIRQAEPVPRGWYAAPIGWIDHTLDGEFGVAIRSAVSQQRRVWLYAGAGIVADSEPEKEWAETELKFRPMLNALGIMNDQNTR